MLQASPATNAVFAVILKQLRRLGQDAKRFALRCKGPMLNGLEDLEQLRTPWSDFQEMILSANPCQHSLKTFTHHLLLLSIIIRRASRHSSSSPLIPLAGNTYCIRSG